MENKIIKVWLDDDNIFIKTSTGEVKNHPLNCFPRLHSAPKSILENFTLSPFGIHWEELDEDLSYEGFFQYTDQSTTLEKK